MAIQAKEDNTIKFQTKCGKAIEQFLEDALKGSKATANAYHGDIKYFLDCLYDKTIDTITAEELELLDRESFRQYVNSFDKKSNNTINRNISTIKTMLTELKKTKVISLDLEFLKFVKSLPNDSTRIEGMPKSVVMNYISEAGREKNYPEVKQKLIMFAVDTALRLEDYLEMKWSQFSPQDGHVSLSGYGKGNKRWLEKISYEVYESLLELKKDQMSNESKVFAPLSKKNVADMMNRIKTNLNYNDRSYSFHSFKKTGVTFTYRLTGDILEAKKKAKHENIETTMLYVEEEDYGMTGMFSLGEYDPEAFKNVSHEKLLAALGCLNKDTLHLLNLKIKQLEKNSN